MIPPPRESVIQSRILGELGRLPWLRLWRASTGVARTMDGERVMRCGLPGQADLSGILADGRRLEIEVKSGRGRLSQRQQAFGAMIERFGGVYLVARSADDALRQLRERGYGQ